MANRDSSKSLAELVWPVWKLVELDRRDLLILFVYILSLGIVSGLVPFMSQIVVNQAAFTGATSPIVILSLIVFGVMLMGAVIKIFQVRVIALISERVFVRTAFLSVLALLRGKTGAGDLGDREIGNRFFDVMTYQSRFAKLISEGLGVIILSVFGVFLLAFYHPLLLAFSLIVVSLCLLIVLPLARRGVRYGAELSKEKYNVAYWISEVAEHRGLLRQARERGLTHGRTDQLCSRYVRAQFQYLNLIVWQGSALFALQALASAIFFGMGGWLVVHGKLNLGQLVASEIVLLTVLGAVGKFLSYLDAFYDVVVAAGKIADLTGSDVDQAGLGGGAALEVEAGVIRSFEVRSPLLVEPLKLAPGDAVLLAGKTKRAGSLLLKAIARQNLSLAEIHYESEKRIPRNDVCHSILYLSQPMHFRMSLNENLTLLSESPWAESERSKIFELPLLKLEEVENADKVLPSSALEFADQARYSVLRAFMTDHSIVLIDSFFDLMEEAHQIEFIKEFKRRFPKRILILNSYSKPSLDLVSRLIDVKEV